LEAGVDISHGADPTMLLETKGMALESRINESIIRSFIEGKFDLGL
jgi:hypothetical protein